MNVRYSSVVKPGSWVRLPNTAARPHMKMVGASTAGITAAGTRAISLIARRISAHVERNSNAMPLVTPTSVSCSGPGR